MIISKTPFRISFFGGGSDYPEWYSKFGGQVISTTINKYAYIYVRELPKLYDYNYRVIYSKDEIANDLNKIKHKPVREILKYFKIKKPLHIQYDGDLPARSGMGSSSAFVVGFLNNILTLQKKKFTRRYLAEKSIFLEKSILKETVGSQDQIACTYGGLNNIKFNKNGSFKVEKINLNKIKLRELESNLFLVYSKVQRIAEVVAKTFVNSLSDKNYKNMEKINSLLNEAKNNLKSNNFDLFGELLNQSWIVKKQLSNKISSKNLDEIYNNAIKAGATGGKLLGAGGGGFFIFYVKKKNQKKFLKKTNNLNILPFKFDTDGSKVISNTKTDF